jgi:hypothetical protein
MAIRMIDVHRLDLARATSRRCGGDSKMPYPGDHIGIGGMLDELVAKGRTEFDAAVELENALNDGKIILWYAGEPVISDLPAIGKFLRDFVSDRKQAWLGYGYLRQMLADSRAGRVQFETVCGLVEKEPPPSNRRFVNDEQLVAMALEGIRSNRWPNAHQAALALQSQADGASPDAKVRRLGEKIRKAMS